jgi:hypothetical protein
MTTHTAVTAPTQFVEAKGIRFAYRRFGRKAGVPLWTPKTEQFMKTPHSDALVFFGATGDAIIETAHCASATEA